VLPAVILLVALTADGDEAPPWSTRFEVASWSIAAGLPQTSVTDIAQDERGFLWLTTFGGVVRFDGATFARLPLEHALAPRFTALAWTGPTLWLGGQDGSLLRLGAQATAPPERVVLSPQPDTIWRLVRRPSGALLVAAGRAGVFEVKDVARRIDSRLALRVAESASGEIWALGAGGVTCIEGCPASQTLLLEHPTDLWRAVDGTLFASGASGTFTIRDQRLELVSPRVIARGTADPENHRSWWAEGGFLLVTSGGRTERVFLPPPRQPWDPTQEIPLAVRTLFVDRQGTLWVGSDNGGLYRVRDRFLRHLGSPTDARSIALVAPAATGALVAGYCTGLFTIDAALTTLTRDRRLADDACVYSFTATDGGVLLGVTDRLYRLGDEGKLEQLYQAPATRELEGVEIKAALEHGDQLLLGTSEGLWTLERRANGYERTSVFDADAGLPSAIVSTLAREPDGRVLVGTTRGLVALSNGALTPVLRPEDDRPATVRDLRVDGRGVVWVATYGDGLGRVEPGPGLRRARWFTSDDGFCTNELSRIVPVGADLWFNSNAGAYRVKTAALEAFVAERGALECEHLPTGEGNGGGMGAGALLADGSLAFPTVDGVALIRPSEVPDVPPAAPVFLESAHLGERRLVEGAEVDAPSRDLEVRLSTPPDAFRSPPRHAWLALSRDGTLFRRERIGLFAKYVDLAPGTWTVEVHPEDRPAGPPTASLRFIVRPRLWERPAMQVFVGLALLAVVIVGFQVLASRARALAEALEERERALAAGKERDTIQRALFDGSPAPLLTYRGTTLEQANPAARTMLGLDERPRTLPFTDADEAARYARWLAGELGVAADFSLAPRGERRQVRMRQARLGPDTSVVAAIDLTAELEAAQQREALLARTAHAQRLEGLGRLAAGVAHDFNNVLATLQLELEDVRKLPNAEAVVADMQASLDTGKRLTQRFLVFGRDEGRPDVIALDEAVTRVRPMLERLLPPDVKLEVAAGAHGAIELAQAHLDQLLLNLVLNAQEAIGSRGRIDVRTTVTNELPPGTVIVAPGEKPWVQLAVADSGRGMTAETLARAFEPFFSTKAQGAGTGMGLAVVHGIATRAMAGIVVHSEPGQGTTLHLLFPRSDRVVSTPTPSPAPRPAPKTNARVLVCEDNPQLRRALVRLFSSVGLSVVDVENGALGLEAFAKEHFDLVVTDLVMPELDGAQLITALRAKGATVPIIIASGYPVDAISRLDDASRVGVESIEKPWKGDSLLQLVLRLVGAERPDKRSS